MAKTSRGVELEKTINKYREMKSIEEWLEKTTPSELKGMIIMYELLT